MVFPIYKEFIQLNNNNKSNNLLKNWEKDLNRHFPKVLCKWPIAIFKDGQYY